jgi:hypothetical protein
MLTGDLLKEHLGPNANLYMLAVVVGILVTGAVASVIATRREQRRGGAGSVAPDADP